jgi:hypothetical protein
LSSPGSLPDICSRVSADCQRRPSCSKCLSMARPPSIPPTTRPGSPNKRFNLTRRSQRYLKSSARRLSATRSVTSQLIVGNGEPVVLVLGAGRPARVAPCRLPGQLHPPRLSVWLRRSWPGFAGVRLRENLGRSPVLALDRGHQAGLRAGERCCNWRSAANPPSGSEQTHRVPRWSARSRLRRRVNSEGRPTSRTRVMGSARRR